MKMRIVTAIVTLLTALTAFPQGTIVFNTSLSGSQATPPNNSLQRGESTLWLDDDNSLYARVKVAFSLPVNSVSLFRSTNPSDLGTAVFEFSPAGWVPPLGGGGGEDDYSLSAVLTASQRSDLLNGLWWINVSTPVYPNGEMRGQILAVPEPSTFGLAGGGLLLMAAWVRRRR
jgi:hypothetical protein